MVRREQGFTLIEILVVITIIAALVGMVTLVIPQGTAARNKVECMNNLRQIGGLLQARDAGNKLDNYIGAGFLLQVADEINDSDLKVFICPGEEPNVDDPRPDAGSDEFIAMYRKDMELPLKVEDRFTSYAGPNWRDFPPQKAGAARQKSRLWGCDKCRNGAAHHDGIAALYDTSKVEFIEFNDLDGMNPEEGLIHVGKNSENKLLEKMVFFPNQ